MQGIGGFTILDLLVEDLVDLTEIKSITDDLRFLVTFIKEYDLLHEAFLAMKGSNPDLVVYPETRFAYVYPMARVDIWGEAQTVVYDDKGVADSYENFCKFAYEVSSIRPHSVSVERHGKGYKHVVGSLRTNLTEDATEKLIYVYYNYHLDPTKREKTMPHLGVNASVEAERDEAAQELDEADLVDEVTTYKLLADLATCARKGDDGEESLDDEADEEDEEDEEDEDEEEEFEFELPSGYRVAPPPEKIEHALKVNNLIAMKFDGWGWAGDASVRSGA